MNALDLRKPKQFKYKPGKCKIPPFDPLFGTESLTKTENSVFCQNKEGKILELGVDFDILTPYNLLKYTNQTDRIHNFYKYTDGKDYEDFGRVTFEVVEKLENCKLII